ncbi:MAG: NAD(P)H-binding protein [Dehalococcoidia bacterium]
MKVFVAGGSGLLGQGITKALLDAGHEVTIGSRSNHSTDSRAGWAHADVTDPASLSAALTGGFDAVVDAVQFPNSPIENPKKGLTFERIDLHGTMNLVDATKAAGIPRFIGISGVGADEHGKYHWLRYKWQEEQHIIASGVPYTILRGSWVYGPNDVSLNRFLGFARWLPFIPVIGNGKTPINPLFIDDLGAHVTAAVERDDLRGRIFELGGPRTLTMDEIVRAALKAADKKRFIMHQPTFLMKLVASIIQFAPGRPLTPDAIDFITQDGVADIGPLQEAFGLPLTPLEEGLSTYLPR